MAAASQQPRNPDFAHAVRDSFHRQALMSTIGAELTSVEGGAIEIQLPYREDLTQQYGFLHGGIVTSLLDTACGYAAFSLMPPESGVLSVEFKVNLLAPAKGKRLIARGQVLRSGRTITVCRADGFMEEGDREVLVATMLATMMTIVDRPDVRG